jgi:4-hydroxy-tetrahydrodipicolinate synthase
MKHAFLGHVVTLVTPFTAQDQVDYPAIQRIIELGLKGGVDAFIALGPGSEYRSLEPKEAHRVLDFILDVLQGRVPLALGVPAASTKATVGRILADLPEESLRLNAQRGLSALLLEVPNDPGISQHGLVQHFLAVAEASPRPILLHQRQGPKGSGLTAPSIIELSNHPKIKGFVDGRCDFALTGEVIRNKAGHFHVLCGDDVSALPMLALGADGAMTSAGNAFPKAFSNLIGQAQFGELHAARATHHQLAPLLRKLEKTAVAPGIKCVLHHLGVCNPSVRLPLSLCSHEDDQAIYRSIANMDRLVSAQ